MSGADYSLLTLLLQHPNQLLSRDEIAQCVWGREVDPMERGIDVQMSRLRKHLHDDDRSIIITVRNKATCLPLIHCLKCNRWVWELLCEIRVF